MKRLTPAEDRILAAARMMHWFTRLHLLFWFTGQRKKRVKWIEYNLPRMVAKGLLKESWHKGKKVYSAWASKLHIEHGLVCSEALIRFLAANNIVRLSRRIAAGRKSSASCLSGRLFTPTAPPFSLSTAPKTTQAARDL
jgi:hypothetical protein